MEYCYQSSQIIGIVFGMILFLIMGIIIGWRIKKA